MKASVIIATYGRNSCLVTTIGSVLRQDYPDFELLVVDQSPDHTPEVESFLRNVDDPRYFYYLVTPPSLPAARNYGFAKSTGEIVIYVDDDVLLDPDFIQFHVAAYQHSQQLGALGGRVRIPNEPGSKHLFKLSSDGRWAGGFDFPDAGELETVRGCNMSFRRSALEKIKGFDPSYEGNALREESDVSFRLRHEGYQVRYEPLAALDHLVEPSGGCREVDLWSTGHYYQNEILFYLKNFDFLFFCGFLFTIFNNQVWSLKRSPMFASRLEAFFTGLARAFRFAFFPKQLEPHAVWELSRVKSSDLREKIKV